MNAGIYAGVAKLADALASGASDRKVLWVQVPSPAFSFNQTYFKRSVFFLLRAEKFSLQAAEL